MKIWTCDNISGVWLNGMALIFAPDKETAEKLLLEECAKQGIPQDARDMEEWPLKIVEVKPRNQARAIILWNGDY